LKVAVSVRNESRFGVPWNRRPQPPRRRAPWARQDGWVPVPASRELLHVTTGRPSLGLHSVIRAGSALAV